METNISVEAGEDDPVILAPWIDPSGVLRYVEPRPGNAWIDEIPEAVDWPEIREALRSIHGGSCVCSVKCDAWELTDEERQLDFGPVEFGFGAYFDLVVRKAPATLSGLHSHVEYWCKEVRHAEVEARCDFVIRPAVILGEDGYAATLYVFGYGKLEAEARENWATALRRIAALIADC